METDVSGLISSISAVKNRGDMIRFFETAMNTSAQSLKDDQKFVAGTNLAKSFIIESNWKSTANLSDLKSKTIIKLNDTEDRNLQLATLSIKGIKKKVEFLLDSKDERFWIFHTLEKSDISKQFIRNLIGASLSKLDNAWLSHDFLINFIKNRQMSEFSAGFETDIPKSLQDQDYISKMSVRIWGTASQRALDVLRETQLRSKIAVRSVRARFHVNEDEIQIYSDERLSSNGVLSASGTSATIHMQTVSNVIKQYKKIIDEIEKGVKDAKSIRDVAPLYMKFTRKKTDLRKFVELVYANMHHLRIFGIPSRISSDYYRIPSVDLHNGDKLDLDIHSKGIRVILWPNACGNTLLRLENRLQKYVDADIDRSE